jgi:AraC-like DNA-binding protein
MRTAGSAADIRAALRAGQERVRALQRKHLLAWARGETTRLTHEAQRRVRLSDRIETAQQALEVLDEALRAYPGEPELLQSSVAVRNFIASVKVGQWVEMAERAAFRGRYSRAIARYRDALFYLSRAEMGDEARHEAAARIQREIEMLRARLDTDDADDAELADPRSAPRVRGRRKREFPAEPHLADETEEAEL